MRIGEGINRVKKRHVIGAAPSAASAASSAATTTTSSSASATGHEGVRVKVAAVIASLGIDGAYGWEAIKGDIDDSVSFWGEHNDCRLCHAHLL